MEFAHLNLNISFFVRKNNLMFTISYLFALLFAAPRLSQMVRDFNTILNDDESMAQFLQRSSAFPRKSQLNQKEVSQPTQANAPRLQRNLPIQFPKNNSDKPTIIGGGDDWKASSLPLTDSPKKNKEQEKSVDNNSGNVAFQEDSKDTQLKNIDNMSFDQLKELIAQLENQQKLPAVNKNKNTTNGNEKQHQVNQMNPLLKDLAEGDKEMLASMPQFDQLSDVFNEFGDIGPQNNGEFSLPIKHQGKTEKKRHLDNNKESIRTDQQKKEEKKHSENSRIENPGDVPRGVDIEKLNRMSPEEAQMMLSSLQNNKSNSLQDNNTKENMNNQDAEIKYKKSAEDNSSQKSTRIEKASQAINNPKQPEILGTSPNKNSDMDLLERVKLVLNDDQALANILETNPKILGMLGIQDDRTKDEASPDNKPDESQLPKNRLQQPNDSRNMMLNNQHNLSNVENNRNLNSGSQDARANAQDASQNNHINSQLLSNQPKQVQSHKPNHKRHRNNRLVNPNQTQNSVETNSQTTGQQNSMPNQQQNMDKLFQMHNQNQRLLSKDSNAAQNKQHNREDNSQEQAQLMAQMLKSTNNQMAEPNINPSSQMLQGGLAYKNRMNRSSLRQRQETIGNADRNNRQNRITDEDLMSLSDAQIKILADRINAINAKLKSPEQGSRTPNNGSHSPNAVKQSQITKAEAQRANNFPNEFNAQGSSNNDKALDSIKKTQGLMENEISRQIKMDKPEPNGQNDKDTQFNPQLLTQLSSLLMRKGADITAITDITELRRFLIDETNHPPQQPKRGDHSKKAEIKSREDDILKMLKNNDIIQNELLKMFNLQFKGNQPTNQNRDQKNQMDKNSNAGSNNPGQQANHQYERNNDREEQRNNSKGHIGNKNTGNSQKNQRQHHDQFQNPNQIDNSQGHRRSQQNRGHSQFDNQNTNVNMQQQTPNANQMVQRNNNSPRRDNRNQFDDARYNVNRNQNAFGFNDSRNNNYQTNESDDQNQRYGDLHEPSNAQDSSFHNRPRSNQSGQVFSQQPMNSRQNSNNSFNSNQNHNSMQFPDSQNDDSFPNAQRNNQRQPPMSQFPNNGNSFDSRYRNQNSNSQPRYQNQGTMENSFSMNNQNPRRQRTSNQRDQSSGDMPNDEFSQQSSTSFDDNMQLPSREEFNSSLESGNQSGGRRLNPDGSPYMASAARSSNPPNQTRNQRPPWLQNSGQRSRDINEDVFGSSSQTEFF